MDKINVLFVCYGNICRSPMGEFILKDLVRKKGLEESFYIESAGTSREELGNPVYYAAREKLKENGIDCFGKVARQIVPEDYNKFDYILGMESGEVYAGFEQRRAEFEELKKHIWGITLRQNKKHNDTSTVHVTFRVHFEDDEKFIYQRLLREKRCGSVTLLDGNNAQFDADIFEPMEIIPWARTFICRITFFDCSEKSIVRRFFSDIKNMNQLYLEEEDGETNAVQ
jgi:Protein-tyrosine-phosphatase